MAELQRRAGFRPLARLLGEDMHIVIDATGDVECFAIGGEGQTHVTVADLQSLCLHRVAGGEVFHEHIFVRGIRDWLAVGREQPVEAAGEDEERLAVRAERGVHGLAGGVGGKAGEMRVEGLKMGAGGGERGKVGATWQDGGAGRRRTGEEEEQKNSAQHHQGSPENF